MINKKKFVYILIILFFISGCSLNDDVTNLSNETSTNDILIENSSSIEDESTKDITNTVSVTNEIILESSSSLEDESSENIIDTTNLTTQQVEEWTYYHERSYWENKGQVLVRGDVQYIFEENENKNLKVILLTKWNKLGIYIIDENGTLIREDVLTHETEFITDKYDVEDTQ